MTLDKLITFYRKQQTQQPDGSLETVKAVISRAMAKVTPGAGGERSQGDQVEGRAFYTFWVLYRNDLIEDDVIDFANREYNVRFISDGGQAAQYLKITAERGVAI